MGRCLRLEVTTVTMEPEQTEAVEEQIAPEVEDQVTPVPPVEDAPEPETPAPEPEAYVPDLTTVAGIAEAERRFPAFKDQQEKHRLDARNAERQRLTRELGEDTRVHGLVSQLRDRLLDADDADAPKTVAEAFKLNGDWHTDRVTRTLAANAARAYGWDEATLKVTLDNLERLTGGDLDGYAENILTASVTAQAKKQAEAEIAAAEKRFQKKYETDLAAAKKAMALESAPARSSPPSTSGGGSAAPAANPRAMSIDEYAAWKQNTSPAEQQRAWATASA